MHGQQFFGNKDLHCLDRSKANNVVLHFSDRMMLRGEPDLGVALVLRAGCAHGQALDPPYGIMRTIASH